MTIEEQIELDKAIKHAEEMAQRCKNDTDWGFANHFIDRSGVQDIIEREIEYRKLVEWLKELKEYREGNIINLKHVQIPKEVSYDD